MLCINLLHIRLLILSILEALFHTCVYLDMPGFARFLLYIDSDLIDFADFSSAFKWAIQSQSLTACKWLLKLKPELAAMIQEFHILYPCADGNLPFVRWLYENDQSGMILIDRHFIRACLYGHVDLAKWILTMIKYDAEILQLVLERLASRAAFVPRKPAHAPVARAPVHTSELSPIVRWLL